MNKVVLLGRLTKDPELRYTSGNNTAVCSFTIAVDRRFTKQGEEKQADFIPIVAWDKTAEFCSKHFSKGRKIAVVGRIETRNYDNKEGVKVYVTEVIAEELDFADSKKDGQESAQAHDNQQQPPTTTTTQQQPPAGNQSQGSYTSPSAPPPPGNRMPWEK